MVLNWFSLGWVEVYSVFMVVLSLPQTLVKTMFKNIAQNLAKNLRVTLRTGRGGKPLSYTHMKIVVKIVLIN